jgi:hypothetical protein
MQPLSFGTGVALVIAWRRMSQLTLRITIEESAEATDIKLEGRIAGLWADELRRTWLEILPLPSARKLTINLRDTTYADADGIQVLREICSKHPAQLVTSTPWTQYLAEEVTREGANQVTQEP